jgi:hypothetical protein
LYYLNRIKWIVDIFVSITVVASIIATFLTFFPPRHSISTSQAIFTPTVISKIRALTEGFMRYRFTIATNVEFTL